tara:strand:- start:36574 stop:37488 length:915 start_codon:yes stop_codon:yes gene_type:complete
VDLAAIVTRIGGEMAAMEDRGQVADYIPQLGRVDPNQFGMAVVTASGETHLTGDALVPFSIQSVSKVFTLAIALGRSGEALWKRVGVEPSGHAFNSILQLETEAGIPRNPFINAGALVVTDSILAGHAPAETLGEILRFVRMSAGDDGIHINQEVAKSEKETGHLNRALAHFMTSHGTLQNAAELICGTYFHQCAIEMNCLQLARAGQFLMGPSKGAPRIVSAQKIRRINALMMTCGHYDGSGEFAFRVGLPGKSGVGGGILVVVPNIAVVAVWSPGLNTRGNSQLGTLAMERLARATGWSVYG